MKALFLDFSKLNLPEPFKAEFTKKVTEIVKEKYQDTGIFITDNPEAASQIPENGLKLLRVHNNQAMDLGNGALGNAAKELQVAEIYLPNFIKQGYGMQSGDLAEQVGLVSAHEGFHLLGPEAHSALPDNLMSDGELTGEILRTDLRSELSFTDFQKSLLRGEIDYDSSMKLSEVEQQYSDLSGLADNSIPDSNSVEVDENTASDEPSNSINLEDFDKKDLGDFFKDVFL